MLRRICLMVTLLAALPLTAQEMTPPLAGPFQIDPAHTRVIFRVSHLGFSFYTAFFTDAQADLVFDPGQPEAMTVKATVRAASVETLYPDPAVNFNAVIAGPDLLDAATYPEITFVSTGIVLTGPQTADVTGDLTLHGVTRPITLAVRYNGGYSGHPMDPGGARIGFSAKGSLARSEFGMGYGVPAPGTTMGVGDTVEVIIETEFLNPSAPKP